MSYLHIIPRGYGYHPEDEHILSPHDHTDHSAFGEFLFYYYDMIYSQNLSLRIMKVRVLWLYSYLRNLFLRFSTVILLLYTPPTCFSGWNTLGQMRARPGCTFD